MRGSDSDTSTSILLNGILSVPTTTESQLDVLRRQQEELQRQLLKQEILNTNLYQSLIDSGFLRSSSTSTSTVVANNILDLFGKNRNSLMNNFNNKNVASTFDSATSNLTNLASILPLGDMFSSLGSVFEKLFGTKFWIYMLFAILIGTMFTIVWCFFMYCCCCNKVGKMLCCCRFGNLFSTSSKKKKKKALSSTAKEDNNNPGGKKFYCC